VVEAHFIEGRGRGEGRDVPPDARLRLVGSDYHRRGVPAYDALDAPFDVRIAGHQRLLLSRDGVDVRRVRGERQLDAVVRRMQRELAEKTSDLDRASLLQDVIERIQPFTTLDGVELRR